MGLLSAVQSAALLVYGTRPVQALLRTDAGRAAFEAAYLGYKELLEARGASVLEAYARRGWVLDVGANIGFFTLKFARWVRPGDRVVAVEPEPTNVRRLEARIGRAGLRDRVVVRRGVAAEADGPRRLDVRPGHPGDHRLASGDGLGVDGWRLDTLVREAGDPHVGLVKIDVQGAERLVLEGALETIRRCRPVLVVELDDAALRSFGSSVAEVAGLLRGLGYDLHVLTAKGLAAAGGELDAPAGGYVDVVALPRA